MRSQKDGELHDVESLPAGARLVWGYEADRLAASIQAVRLKLWGRKVSVITTAGFEQCLTKEQAEDSQLRRVEQQRKGPLLSRCRDTVACVDVQQIRVRAPSRLKRRSALGCGARTHSLQLVHSTRTSNPRNSISLYPPSTQHVYHRVLQHVRLHQPRHVRG